MSLDKDVAAGLFFVSLGVLGLVIGADYAFGTTARMGAGFVPKLLSWGLVGLGCLIALGGLARRPENAMDTWAFGPLLVIIAAVVAFGACLEPYGLEGATIGAILIASAGRARQNALQICLLIFAIIGLTASLYPGINRLLGASTVTAILAASGAALLLQWLIYAFGETRRALIEQAILALVLAVLSVIVFADLLGLPFKSLFVQQLWMPIKTTVFQPVFQGIGGVIKAVRGLFKGA
ncbi:MAG: tripartite tricarboxylate transporter TctB family protein [Hyphomicrobiaceae bacterium]